MRQPLINILVKVFAKGFYKVNAGLLVFLFVMLISYCFFIDTAGDIKLMTRQAVLYYNFILLINFVTSPLMTALFFMAWLMYTIKSWTYVASQLPIAYHQFVYYSSLSFSRVKQFKSWFYTQSVISLPFIFYALLASVIAALLHHFTIIAVIVSFTLVLISISALLYVTLVNKLMMEKRSWWLFRISRYWRKPFFSLYLYYVFDRLKINLLLSKLLSLLMIVSMLFAFQDARNDLRVAGIAILGVVTAHVILIFQQHRFECTFLSISRNLPYRQFNIYLNLILTYLFLILPEVIWLVASFPVPIAFSLLLLMLSLFMLFHCLLYHIGLAMNSYLPWVLTLFIILFCMMLFGLMWVLIPLCFIVSYLVFSHNYYKAELIAGV